MPLLPEDVMPIGAQMRDGVPTIKDVSAPPALVGSALYAMAQPVEIPASRIPGEWRIKRAALDQWIEAQPRGEDGGNDGRA